MRLRLGEILVQRGVLTPGQRAEVLAAQQATGRPFGLIAEQMFGVGGDAIEAAWTEQYAADTRWVDPRRERVDPAVLELIDRRRAWQFAVLPMAYDGDEVMVCTTPMHLPRALRFVSRTVPELAYFVLSEPEALAEALMYHYPMPGMSRQRLSSAPFAEIIREAG